MKGATHNFLVYAMARSMVEGYGVYVSHYKHATRSMKIASKREQTSSLDLSSESNLSNTQDNNSEISLLKQQIDLLKKELSDVRRALAGMKDVLPLSDAADYLGLTRSALYKLTHNNEIPFYKPHGKMCYFERIELDNWMRRGLVMSKTQIAAKAEAIEQRLATR